MSLNGGLRLDFEGETSDWLGRVPALDSSETVLYAVSMQLTLTTKIDIPQQAIEDVLTTAIEGGISYWAEGENICRRHDLTVWSARVWDYENPHEKFLLDADAMLKGVRLLHEAIMKSDIHPDSEIGGQFMEHLFTNNGEDLGCVDVVCADAIVQMTCFGKLVFG